MTNHDRKLFTSFNLPLSFYPSKCTAPSFSFKYERGKLFQWSSIIINQIHKEVAKFRIESPDQQDRQVDISNSRRGDWFRWPPRRKFSSRASQIQKAKNQSQVTKSKHNWLLFQNLKKLINAKRKRAKENQPLTTRDQCKASSSSCCCSYCRYNHQFHITSQSQPHDDCWSGESKRKRKTSETSSYESGWQWIKHGDLNRKWRRRRLLAAAVW